MPPLIRKVKPHCAGAGNGRYYYTAEGREGSYCRLVNESVREREMGHKGNEVI